MGRIRVWRLRRHVRIPASDSPTPSRQLTRRRRRPAVSCSATQARLAATRSVIDPCVLSLRVRPAANRRRHDRPRTLGRSRFRTPAEQQYPPETSHSRRSQPQDRWSLCCVADCRRRLTDSRDRRRLCPTMSRFVFSPCDLAYYASIAVARHRCVAPPRGSAVSDS